MFTGPGDRSGRKRPVATSSGGSFLPLAGGTMTGKEVLSAPGLGSVTSPMAPPSEMMLFDQDPTGASSRAASDSLRFRTTGNNGAAVHGDFRVFADPGVNNSLSLSCLHFQTSSDTTTGIDGAWTSRFKIFRDGGAVLIGTVIQLGDAATGSYAQVTNDPTQPAFAVHSFSTQTGDIQQWWDKNGNLVGSIDDEGKFTIFGYVAGTTTPLLVYDNVGAPAIVVNDSGTSVNSSQGTVNLLANTGIDISAGSTINLTATTFLSLVGPSGIALFGPVSVNSNLISDVADPTNPQDAATKAYVDAAGGAYLPLSGGVLAGTLDVSVGTTAFYVDPSSPVIAFFAATPVNQQGAIGGGGGHAVVGGLPVSDRDTFAPTAGTAYTIGDVITALINYGLLAP